MQIHALPPAAKSAQGPLRRHAPRLIELCGTPRFEPELFQAAREATACEHLTAFAFADSTKPRIVLAANATELPVARQVAQKYIHQYWALDPARTLEPPKVCCGGDYALRFYADEIEHSDYRQDCYTGVGLHDRISLITTRDGETLRVNFYKAAKCGRFTPEEVDHIMEASDLILSLLAKHDAVALPAGKDVSRAFERRLKLVAKRLPRREMEVCTLIATGMSSEGIALDLGVSLNTVLTHRKRAYARLGISSQNELLRLLLC
ncbi:MAG: LuxR C-terminal-related transcriptional regulator [Nevskiales bacterium]